MKRQTKSRLSLVRAVPLGVFLKFLTGLTAISLPAGTQAQVDIPTQVGVDIVFPRDDTYSPADPFPVVFALSGATAAWTYGFDFAWRTRRADGCTGQCGVVWSGELSVREGLFGGVSFGAEDAYFLTTSTRGVAAEDYDGGYTLEWEFGLARNCSTSPTGAVQSTGGVVSASGIAQFRIQRDANALSDAVSAQLRENCPLAGGVVGIQEDLDGCPQLGGDVTPDPCALDVPDDVVNYVVSALAASPASSPVASPPSSTIDTSSTLVPMPASTTTTTTDSTSSTLNTTPTSETTASPTSSVSSTCTSGETETTSTTVTSSSSDCPASFTETSSMTTTTSRPTDSKTSSSYSAPSSTKSPTVNAAPVLSAVVGFSEPVTYLFILFWGLWLI